MSGSLYIISTPIGNLEDITLRALRVLKEVDLIACEDTRVTKKLLDHYEIKTPTVSYFQHSKLSKIEYLISELQAGKNIALVSDAGTPGISDPGQFLIDRIKQISKSEFLISNQNPIPNTQIKIVPIPGASALVTAASVSGIIEKEFFFAGFLPKKKGRQTEFKRLSKLDSPIIVYESAERLARTLEDFRTYFGETTTIFIAREMTKMFEEYWSGPVSTVIADLPKHTLKGEVVVIVKKLQS